MGRNQTRRFSELLRIAGVTGGDTQKGPNISDDIQMVYVMDDVRDLLPQLARPTFIMTEFSPSNVARRGQVELHAPADAASLIQWFRNDDSANIVGWSVSTLTKITADLSASVPDVSLGGVSRSLLQEGTGVGVGDILLAAGDQIPANFPVLIIPPGSILQFSTIALNVSVAITIAWLEIPVPDPVLL